jgi:hypothetical protein
MATVYDYECSKLTVKNIILVGELVNSKLSKPIRVVLLARGKRVPTNDCVLFLLL